MKVRPHYGILVGTLVGIFAIIGIFAAILLSPTEQTTGSGAPSVRPVKEAPLTPSRELLRSLQADIPELKSVQYSSFAKVLDPTCKALNDGIPVSLVRSSFISGFHGAIASVDAELVADRSIKYCITYQ